MATQKGNKLYLILIIIFLVGMSCSNSVYEIEKLLDIPIRNEISFENSESQWNEFNGDGYKVDIYNVNTAFVNRLYSVMLSKNYEKYEWTKWNESEIYPYIKNSNGLYRIYNFKNVKKIIFLNVDSRTLIYYIIIM